MFEKYKNRVGSFADKVKAASQINVEEPKENLPIHKSSTNHDQLTKANKTSYFKRYALIFTLCIYIVNAPNYIIIIM